MNRQIVIDEGLAAFEYFQAIFDKGEYSTKNKLGSDYDRCLREYMALIAIMAH